MAICARCCLHQTMRIVNVFKLLFGIGMIIYSLWLQKKWKDGLAELPDSTSLPIPWFIATCLGVGMAVSLSTICGHIVANHITNSTVCIYIVTICCLLFIEVVVIVAIFFKMNWGAQIAAYIDEAHEKFESFVLFHVKICRLITLLIVVAQVTVVILAVILCLVGTEPRSHCSELEVPDFAQSFLVPNSPGLGEPRQSCSRCENLLGESPTRSFLSYLNVVLRMPFHRSDTIH